MDGEGKGNYRERLSEVKRSLFLKLRWKLYSWSGIVTLSAHVSTHRPTAAHDIVEAEHIVIIFPFEWECDERVRGMGRRKLCPFFVKLFEYISLTPRTTRFFHFLCCREKHRTMDRFAWSFSLLPAFSADRSVKILIFAFSVNPLASHLRVFVVVKNINKKKKRNERCWMDFSSLLIASLTDSSIEKLSRIWDATSFLWRASREKSLIAGWWYETSERTREKKNLASTKKTIETFFVISFLSEHEFCRI